MSTTKRDFAEAARQVEAFYNKMGDVFSNGLRVIGEEIMTDVRAARPRRGVPVDTGVLRASLTVEQPAKKRVILAAGGAASAYALVQHERLDYKHTVGEARYLVRGTDRWKPDGSSAMNALKHNADAAARIVAARAKTRRRRKRA